MATPWQFSLGSNILQNAQHRQRCASCVPAASPPCQPPPLRPPCRLAPSRSATLLAPSTTSPPASCTGRALWALCPSLAACPTRCTTCWPGPQTGCTRVRRAVLAMLCRLLQSLLAPVAAVHWCQLCAGEHDAQLGIRPVLLRPKTSRTRLLAPLLQASPSVATPSQAPRCLTTASATRTSHR